MKIQEEPSTAAPYISNEGFTKPLQSEIAKHIEPETFPWSEDDTYYTKLFRAWESLPIHEASKETDLLMELDHIISHFDSYIGHNDLGFRSWIKRHQLAMQIELVETPTWPKLYMLKGDEKMWRNEVWISRYSFLVHQRDIIAKSRLRRMKSCKLEDKKQFFGPSWAYPRQTVRTGTGTPDGAIGAKIDGEVKCRPMEELETKQIECFGSGV